MPSVGVLYMMLEFRLFAGRMKGTAFGEWSIHEIQGYKIVAQTSSSEEEEDSKKNGP